jgi:hypothetical protein
MLARLPFQGGPEPLQEARLVRTCRFRPGCPGVFVLSRIVKIERDAVSYQKANPTFFFMPTASGTYAALQKMWVMTSVIASGG